MNILITGGTGLIGQAFMKAYQDTHTFTVLSRSPGRARQQLGGQHQYLLQLSELNDLSGFDAVINLAGEPIAARRWTRKQKSRIQQSRWRITRELTELFEATAEPPGIFISGSAVGYYGRQDDQPVTENEYTVHQEFSHDLCREWEALAWTAADTSTTRVCLLRTGIVLAPQGGALARMLPPFKLGLGGPISHGRQMMSWIHLDDMVGILDFLLHSDSAQGPYNATAPNPVSNREFSQTLGAVLQRPAVLPVPAPVLKLAFGEMADLLLTGQAVLPERLQETGYTFQYPELKPALAHCTGRPLT